MMKKALFVLLMLACIGFMRGADNIKKHIWLLDKLYEWNKDKQQYEAVKSSEDLSSFVLEKNATGSTELPITRFGQFFNPITKGLQSVSDLLEKNMVARLTAVLGVGLLTIYIRAKIQHRMMSINKPAVEQIPEKELTTFKDYMGKIPEAVLDLVSQLKNREKYLKMNIPVTKGILLYGPPGSGKTYLARAIAGEIGCPFFAVAGTYFSESVHGQGKITVQNLFARAENAAYRSPTKTAIIFIDEIDAVGTRARAQFAGGQQTEIINTLLNEMDGFYQREDINVVVIGATNLLENVDEALRRSGRLDYKIEVPYLDKEGRTKLIEYFLKKFPSDKDVQADWLAEMTSNLSPADIKVVFEIAGRVAARNDKEQRDSESFVEAVEQVKKPIEQKQEIAGERRTLDFLNGIKSKLVTISIHEN